MVDAGEIFHPLRWTPQVATRMLRDIPQLESAGIVVRMPAGWKENRPLRPQVIAKIGGNVPSRCGEDALLDFRMDVVLDGEPLTSTEIKHLLSETDGLTLIRGRWVEVAFNAAHRLICACQMRSRPPALILRRFLAFCTFGASIKATFAGRPGLRLRQICLMRPIAP
jgi:hypothetical protein